MRTIISNFVVFSLLLFLTTVSLTGFVEDPTLDSMEIPLYEVRGLRLSEVRGMTATADESFANFLQRYGGSWQYQINMKTGSFHHIFGSGIQLAARIIDEETLEESARSFISDNQGLFKVESENLKKFHVGRSPGKWSIIFTQTHQGVAVWGSKVYLVFTDSGRLFAFGSDVFGDIDVSTVPSLTEEEALSIAKESIGYVEGRDRLRFSGSFVLPVGQGYRLSYRFDLHVEEPYGLWATYIDAHTGEILWRENHIRAFVDFIGHVQADVEWDGYCDGTTQDYPLKSMYINISGVGTTTTDENGDFTLSYGGSDPKSISAEFRGPWCNVERYGGPDASHSGTITPGTLYTIDWDNGNSLYSERDCFAYVNKQHDWLKDIDPSYTGMDYELPTYVERTDGYCPGNAWWDGYSINMCYQASGYANTGRMGDVVYHEYGHGITDFLYGYNDPPGDLHEGNSDIVANLLTREHIIGLGFYLNNCTSGIRDSENTLIYPDDLWGEGHHDGQIIAGFIWDSWQELLAAYPQDYADSVIFHDWHFGRDLGLPQTQPDQVYWTFVADDDDGNLDNGTPHHDQLCVGATNHGFDCPEILVGVLISHTPLTTTTEENTPFEVLMTMVSTEGNILIDNSKVYYRTDSGSWNELSISATGEPDEYFATIPGQPQPTQIDYYIYGEDDVGNFRTHPEGAPAEYHSFYVAWLYEPFETGLDNFTIGAPDDDATTGIWERVDPVGTYYGGQVQPEDDFTPDPGTDCYITGQHYGGDVGQNDVDNGKTTLFSDVYDLTGAVEAWAIYRRWFSNDLGASPGEDYWLVQISNDGGDTWQNVEYTNDDAERWLEVAVDIVSFFPSPDQVQFKFVASDEWSGSLVEAGVDEFIILADIGPVNHEPEFSAGGVTPVEGQYCKPFTFSIYYYDADGDSPSVIQVYIDGTPFSMSLSSGTPSDGTYEYETLLSVGTHSFYFYAEDGQGGSVRLPESGELSGPEVDNSCSGPPIPVMGTF
ncbi:MAG: hypothetical protein ACE5OP_00655 [Candidatus Glassbacteria bacterium]